MARRDLALPFALHFEAAAASPEPTASERLAAALSADRARLRSVALRITHDPTAADDAVQNAFEKALRHGAAFRGEAKPSTWLHRIVVNEALAWHRSEARRDRFVLAAHAAAKAASGAPCPHPLDELLLRERRDRVLGKLASLRAGDGELLARSALEGSYAGWARAAGMKTTAAKARAFRARRVLRAALAELDE